MLDNDRSIYNGYQGGDSDALTPFYCDIAQFIHANLPFNFSLLNFGCGVKLQFEKHIIREFPDAKLGGVDINVPHNKLSNFDFYNYDVQKIKRFGFGEYDIVYFTELIEHVDDGDALLDNCYLNCKKEGWLICTVPNLASLYGRLELLFGFQPHILEASNRYPLAGGGVFAKKNNPDGKSIHHIRGFTYRAMCELIKRHGFSIIQTKGNFPLGRIPGIAGDNLIIARKTYIAGGHT